MLILAPVNTNEVTSDPKESQKDKCRSKLLDPAALEELVLEQEAALGKDEYFEKFLEFVKRDKGIVWDHTVIY